MYKYIYIHIYIYIFIFIYTHTLYVILVYSSLNMLRLYAVFISCVLHSRMTRPLRGQYKAISNFDNLPKRGIKDDYVF